MRSIHRQPAELLRNYRALMIAAATTDATETGSSGLAAWIAERVEPLLESVQEYVAGQPAIVIDRPPNAAKRWKAYHEITIRLMKL
ncbi:MAG: hypothetical protein ACRD3E_06305, partial [Terriglobales bacterium]